MTDMIYKIRKAGDGRQERFSKIYINLRFTERDGRFKIFSFKNNFIKRIEKK